MDLDTFRLLGVKKIVHDRKWVKIVCNIKGYFLLRACLVGGNGKERKGKECKMA